VGRETEGNREKISETGFGYQEGFDRSDLCTLLRTLFAGDITKRSPKLPGSAGVSFAGIMVEIAVRELQSEN
jgi:hypothetical protein